MMSIVSSLRLCVNQPSGGIGTPKRAGDFINLFKIMDFSQKGGTTISLCFLVKSLGYNAIVIGTGLRG